MPRKTMNYSKCVIYKITCCDENVLECYVGHTTNFIDRKYRHKSGCKTKTLKLYQMIRENGGWQNWIMTPICEYPCENHIQACIKEEECRIELEAKLNMIKCFNTYNQYYTEHKEQIDERMKKWREANKEQIAKYKKEYCKTHKKQISEKMNKKNNCECGGKYTHCHKLIHERTKKHQNYISSFL